MAYYYDFADNVTYGASDINGIRASIFSQGVVRDAPNSLLVLPKPAGLSSGVIISPGQAVFSDGCRLVVEEGGHELSTPGSTYWVVLQKNSVSGACYPIATPVSPSNNDIPLAFVSSGIIQDVRTWAKFKATLDVPEVVEQLKDMPQGVFVTNVTQKLFLKQKTYTVVMIGSPYVNQDTRLAGHLLEFDLTPEAPAIYDISCPGYGFSISLGGTQICSMVFPSISGVGSVTCTIPGANIRMGSGKSLSGSLYFPTEAGGLPGAAGEVNILTPAEAGGSGIFLGDNYEKLITDYGFHPESFNSGGLNVIPSYFHGGAISSTGNWPSSTDRNGLDGNGGGGGAAGGLGGVGGRGGKYKDSFNYTKSSADGENSDDAIIIIFEKGLLPVLNG